MMYSLLEFELCGAHRKLSLRITEDHWAQEQWSRKITWDLTC